MTFDPNSLLTREELLTSRTPIELSDWVKEKLSIFATYPEAEEWVLFHKGLFKQFYEEVYPLSLLAKHLYAERSDIKCLPDLDKRDFDAKILDYSTSPPSELKVEITYAVDGYNEHLRMKFLVKNGHANAFGKVDNSGTKHTGHKIHLKSQSFKHTDLLEQSFSRIRLAVERKSNKYSREHVLLVAFKYPGVLSEQDKAALKDYVEKHVLILPLNFAALYIVEVLKGTTFVSFELT
jgi:hypothetical protein